MIMKLLICKTHIWKHVGTFCERWNRGFTSLSKIETLIHQNTEISRNHMTPEIALHLITSSCPLWKARPEDCPFSDPFWAFYWPGGQAVTRFILDNPNFVRGLSVIDIGSGSGACAIAASKCGAKLAIANDIDPVAGVAAKMNAALNDTSILISSDNHIKDENAIEGITRDNLPWDIIILGDLFYDAKMSRRVMTWAGKCSSLGLIVLIGDPGRYTFITESKSQNCYGSENVRSITSHPPGLCHLKSYPLSKESCLENNGFSLVSVWKLYDKYDFCQI